MKTMNFKPSPVAVAILAIGAVYYLSRQRQGVQRLVSPGQGTAAQNPATRAYLVPGGNAYSNPTAGGTTQRYTPEQSLISQGIGLFSSLVNRGGARQPGTGPTTGGYFPGEIIRPADFVPNYTPDAAGEAAAQAYYFSNPDEFISNPPPTFIYNDGQVGGGGWLDQQ